MHYSIRLLVTCLIVLLLPTFALAAKTHRIKKNESLFSIAKKYHLSVKELKQANNLVTNKLKPGQSIIIPSKQVASNRAETDRSPRETYRVKKGETLQVVARKTGIPVKELKRLNTVSKKLKPGQVLVLRERELETDSLPKAARKVELRYPGLFNEKDYEQSLSELAESDANETVDLKKNLELNADNTKLLRNTAYGFLGTRYRFGGSSRKGIDCSSFVQQVFREMEVSLPRTAREQFEVGNEVSPYDLQKGDLIFFRTYASYPSHVGIYLGNNKMIHASSRDGRVVISPMNTAYYRSRFIGAKRISKINPDIFPFEELFAGIEEETDEDTLTSDAMGVSLAN